MSFNSEAQYFGKNKPGYSVFRYDVLRTPNYDIYHNFKNDTLIDEIARMSEYWYNLHSTVFGDTLRRRNPLLIYENHADFQQTNVSSDIIDVGTGGLTEGLKNRVVMPVSFTYSQTNHVPTEMVTGIFTDTLLKRILRLNLFGYMVIEPYYAVPFQD